MPQWLSALITAAIAIFTQPRFWQTHYGEVLHNVITTVKNWTGNHPYLAAAIVGGAGYLLYKIATSNSASDGSSDPTKDPLVGVPGTANIILIAAGTLSLSIGLNLASDARPYQTAAITAAQLPSFLVDLQGVVATSLPRDASGNVNLAGNEFVLPPAPGSTGKAAYTKTITFTPDSNGGYTAEMITLDPHAHFVGPVGPDTKRAFFVRRGGDPNGIIDMNPDARRDLDAQITATKLCADPDVTPPSQYAACMQGAAAVAGVTYTP